MGRNSRLKKDRKIIRDNVDKMFKEAENETNEKEFFNKLSVVQNFDYLVQEDKSTKNNFMHKVILEKLRDMINNKVIVPGIEEKKNEFDKFIESKNIPNDISLRDLSLFSIYFKDKIMNIKTREDYKDSISYLNDNETVSKIMNIKKQNKELSDLSEDDSKFISDYILKINNVMEIVNNEIIDLGDKIMKKSKDFKIDEKNPSFEESIFSAYIISFNNNIFKLAVKEVEDYNKILDILKLNNSGDKK